MPDKLDKACCAVGEAQLKIVLLFPGHSFSEDADFVCELECLESVSVRYPTPTSV